MNSQTDSVRDRQEGLPHHRQPRAAYIHVPFCAHHCCYCDFAVVAGKDHLADRYLDALAQEMASLQTPQEVETIFIGGGTPTHLKVPQLVRLLETIRAWFQPSVRVPGLNPAARKLEFSVEANPGTLDADKIGILADYGVNRLSLGAQSSHTHLLQILERTHSWLDVTRAVESSRQRICEISLDLIFGVPGQTLAQWREDLQRAVDLGINHLSTYGLTFEKGTPLWKRREAGAVTPVGEELERAMYGEAMDVLAGAGFEHYEISSFARPGHRCRHNQVYWANEAHFGFGLGAARYVHGRRETNTRDLGTYLRKVSAGEAHVQQSEKLDPEDRARETAMVQMRRAEGIGRESFLAQTGYEMDALVGDAVRLHIEGGLLVDDGRRVCLTREGKFFADLVSRDLLSV